MKKSDFLNALIEFLFGWMAPSQMELKPIPVRVRRRR